MKIGLVSNMYPSAKNKTYGIFVKNFVDVFTKIGVEFSDLSIIQGRRESIFSKIYAYFRLYISIIVTVFFRRNDLIYVHYPLHVSPILYFLRLFSLKPLVINFHGSDLFSNSKIAISFNFFLKRIVRNCELIVVPSNYFKNEIVKKFLVDPDKVEVFPSSGIDFDIFNRNDTFAYRNNEYAAGLISRIDEGKGWKTFLLALNIVKDKNCFAGKKFLILGSGRQDDEKTQLIQKLNLDSIIDIKPEIQQDMLSKYYKSMDVFVFPSERKAESLGLVGLEAMACGIPVIGADNGGIPDYIINGENGFIFKAGDPEDLAEKMEKFFELSQLERNGFMDNAYKKASEYENTRVCMTLYKKLKTIIPFSG